MLKGKKIIIIVASIIVLLGTMITIILSLKENPLHIVEKTLKIELSTTAKVEKYTYYDDGGYYKIKILLEEKQVSDLKNKLDDIFYNSIVPKQDYGKIPNFIGTCSWWDLNKENIVVVYNTFFGSVKEWFKLSPETHDVWAFIVKQNDGKHYLYISY